MSNWKFEQVDSIPLHVKSNHVFFHPTLIDVWIKTYKSLRNITPIFIKGISDSSDVYIPFVLWRRNWKNAFIRKVVPIGYSDYDYSNPIFTHQPSMADEKAFWRELIDFLFSTFDFDELVLDGVTDISTFGSPFSQGEICPKLNLSGINSEDDLMMFFKTSLRGDIRRQIRRLSELGDLTLKEYNSWDEIPKETFAEFMRQHSARWPKAYKAPHFHENLLRDGLKAGVTHFSVLSVGEIEIAWHLGFSYSGRYYYYMPAGKQDYFKYSPTKVHLFYLVRRAVELGYDVFDHLRGEENYKSGWSNGFQHVNKLVLNNDSALTLIKNSVLGMRKIIGK